MYINSIRAAKGKGSKKRVLIVESLLQATETTASTAARAARRGAGGGGGNKTQAPSPSVIHNGRVYTGKPVPEAPAPGRYSHI